MPIDLGQVDWFYVAVLALFALFANFVANLLSFNRRGLTAVLASTSGPLSMSDAASRVGNRSRTRISPRTLISFQAFRTFHKSRATQSRTSHFTRALRDRPPPESGLATLRGDLSEIR